MVQRSHSERRGMIRADSRGQCCRRLAIRPRREGHVQYNIRPPQAISTIPPGRGVRNSDPPIEINAQASDRRIGLGRRWRRQNGFTVLLLLFKRAGLRRKSADNASRGACGDDPPEAHRSGRPISLSARRHNFGDVFQLKKIHRRDTEDAEKAFTIFSVHSPRSQRLGGEPIVTLITPTCTKVYANYMKWMRDGLGFNAVWKSWSSGRGQRHL